MVLKRLLIITYAAWMSLASLGASAFYPHPDINLGGEAGAFVGGGNYHQMTESGIAVLPDGKIMVVGWFSEIGGVPRERVARLQQDGSVDQTFEWEGVANPGPHGYQACSLALQPDGKVLVGGGPTQAFDWEIALRRLNPDGSADGGFLVPSIEQAMGSYPACAVRKIAVQADGKILIGGQFNEINGVPRANIARLHPDGSLDTEFNPVISFNHLRKFVMDIVVQSDGKIVVAGYIEGVNGQPRQAIARLNADGSLDPEFHPVVTLSGDSDDALVANIEQQSDGGWLIAGYFSEVDGIPRWRMARLHPDGSLDEDFVPYFTGVEVVVGMAIQSDGKIVVGGRTVLLGWASLPALLLPGYCRTGTSTKAFSPLRSRAFRRPGTCTQTLKQLPCRLTASCS